MANEQNLRPSEYKFTQEDAKKGQEASVKKEGKTKNLRKHEGNTRIYRKVIFYS